MFPVIHVRTEREIALLREANQIVARLHEAMKPLVKPGVTTGEIDALAEEMIRAFGATPAFKGYHGYPACTCISVDEEVVHGIPGKRVLKEGNIVSIDVGVRYKGYYGDAAVTHPCGQISPEKEALLDHTDRALAGAVAAAKEGNFLNDIGRAVEAVCRKGGYGIVEQFVGHGIGTQMHEEPQVANFDTGRRGPRLKSGMVLAIEPMINVGTHVCVVLADGWTAVTKDGKPSAHFEHTVVVRKDGGEILSGSEELRWGGYAGNKKDV